MKLTFPTCHPLRNEANPPRWFGRRAFSLVEVTLALGLVTFVLVGIIGTMPIALDSGRQSFDQSRAAAIADSLFASFRSQSFSNVCYLDSQFDGNGENAVPGVGLNLNTMRTATPAPKLPWKPKDPACPQAFYASFLEADATNSEDAFGAQRKLAFTAADTNAGAVTPSSPLTGSSYLVTLYFNNRPDGMAISPGASTLDGDSATGSSTPAQANQIEMIISPVGQPGKQYHFVSTIANRL